MLARHLERAERPMEASAELLSAGQQTMQRSAFAEAAALLSRGIELTRRADAEEAAKARLELGLRSVLGGALVVTRGFAAPEYEASCLRARELCEALGDPPELFAVVFSLWQLYVVRGDRPEAVEGSARELSAIAEASRRASGSRLTASPPASGSGTAPGPRQTEGGPSASGRDRDRGGGGRRGRRGR